MHWKKRIAKEWLWLISLLVAILLFWIYNFHGKDIFDFPEVSILSIVFILFVYFVRLTVWAIKELGNNETGNKKKLDWGRIGRFLLYKMIFPFTPSEVPRWLSTIGISQTILGYIFLPFGVVFFFITIYAFFTYSSDWEVFWLSIVFLVVIVLGIRLLIGGEKISSAKNPYLIKIKLPHIEEYSSTEDLNKSDDKTLCPDGNCTGIINPEGICSECGRTPEEIRGGVESKAATLGSYTPLKQKSRWGWGWFLLLSLIAPGFQKTSYYATPITVSIMLVGAIVVLIFYFWLRNKLIERNKYSEKVWHQSFKAGFISYLLALFLIGAAAFIGVLQEKSNIRTEIETLSKEYKAKFIQLRQEEIKIDESFISTPTSNTDIKHNIKKLNEYLVLLNKKNNLLKNFTGYLKEQVKGKMMKNRKKYLVNSNVFKINILI